ncbi:MAG: extracellular solute-binding protein, partial [Anaerolineae bacterium]|nr:extracellular solute-binding protein [Anaerolineae bacterium]
FMAANPDIVVEYTHIPDADFYTALATALASGSGPDLFNTWTGQIGQLHTAGVLAPLDFEAAGFAGIESVYAAYESGETLLAGARFADTLYGLPTELSIYGCYANNDMFEAAGLDPEADFPATWEEMVGVAEKLTVREDGVPTIRGYDFNWSGPIFMYLTMMPMVEQLGVTVINEEDYTADINNDAVKKVMQYWADWVNVHNLGGPQYTFSRDAFTAKELAIECTMGNWAVPSLTENEINWSLHPVPRWADATSDNGFAIYAYFLMVNSYSAPEVQSAAWKLARFLTDHPKEYFDVAGLLQPRAEFTSSEEFQADPVMPLFFEEMTKSKPHARIAGFDEVANALGDGRDRIIAGEDIDTVLAETEDNVNRILERALREAQAGS